MVQLQRLHSSLLIGTFIASLAFATGRSFAQTGPQPGHTPVLVELFTSEGCSSCPPADALLARLQREQPVSAAEIIALEEHVDYWDQLGWHDRFSSRQYTDRQNQYGQRLRFDEPYTPQMVVDGTDQFVGNNASLALRTITKAAQTRKIGLSLSPMLFDGNHVAGTVSVAATAGNLPKGDIYAALVDSSASTDVLRGENGGRKLQHVSVVRSMQKIGKLQDLASGPVKFGLNAAKDSNASNMRVVVFAQLSDQGPVLGAASLPVGR